MRKVLLALFLSLLVSLPLLASAPKAPRRPLAPAPSPIAHIWAQVRSFLRGNQLSTDQHNLPPPPSTVIAGS